MALHTNNLKTFYLYYKHFLQIPNTKIYSKQFSLKLKYKKYHDLVNRTRAVPTPFAASKMVLELVLAYRTISEIHTQDAAQNV